MRTGSVLFLLAAAAVMATVTGAVAAGDGASEGGADTWAGHAVSDDDVARGGRAAMPFTAKQIEALGRLLQETQRAASVAADPVPQGRIRRVRIGSPGEGAIPMIAVRKGYVTAVSFADATGAPWPIEDALVDARFLSETVVTGTVRPAGGAGDDGGAGRGSGRVPSHLLYLFPQARSLHGNAAVKLLGLAEPLVLSLRGGGADTDFRVEIRLGLPGPNAEPAATAPSGFHAGNAVLLDLLGGIAPPGAERLMVEGGGRDDRAWRVSGDLLLVTRAHLLSPGPWAAERGAGGRWAYRLPDVPHALVSQDGGTSLSGRETRLAFRAWGESGVHHGVHLDRRVSAHRGAPLFPGLEREGERQ